ncbi:YciI family protein [Streptomyces sp. NPDC006289]|uniref:YciI family protein n=1 Tax=unclassified Streptomyces TaxID=2593676 RepID=UPI0033B106D2
MPVFAVTYTYTDDTEARDRHRPAHREFLGALGDRGINLCSGPFGPEEAAGALVLIRADSKEAALGYTDADPFRVNGVVSAVDAREWIPVLGPLAAHI